MAAGVTVAEEDLLYRVAFPASQVPMDRDFILNWHPLPGTSPLAAVFTRHGSSESNAEPATKNSAAYASIMLVPPQQLFEGTCYPFDPLVMHSTKRLLVTANMVTGDNFNTN